MEAYEKMINIGSKTGSEGGNFTIHRPLVNLSKAEIVKLGHSLGVNYKRTVSCYQANEEGRACGKCESCDLRKQGFLDNNFPDETLYI